MSDFVMAAIQAAPIHFDREGSTAKACRLIVEAGAQGATIAAFGEAWLPGYPVFAHIAQGPRRWELGSAYLANAVQIPGPATERLCAAAAKAGIDVVIGVAELDERTRGTVYATLLFIGRDGDLIGKHRKLKPSFHERTVWGEGVGTSIRVHERPYGRISGLNCWEHMMMLPGYALASQGTQIHVAAWPGSEPEIAPAAPTTTWPRQVLLSRAFACQAGAYVICAAGVNRKSDHPEAYRDLLPFEQHGGSCIIDPRGEVIVGPVSGREEILIAPGSFDLLRRVKAVIDIGGHYSRPDVFDFKILR